MSDRSGYIIRDQFATHFVTFTTVGWVDLFSRKACADILIDSFRYCMNHKGLVIHAYVVMSNHVHMIATAHETSSGLSAILRDMKKHTAKKLIAGVLKSGKESRKEWLEMVFKYYAKYNKNNGAYQVWQQKNHPKICLHPKFTKQKINYIHQNPVEAGIVDSAEDYLHSSARNYAGRDDCLMEVEIIDFGVEEGYVLS